ncbi:4-hydroxy-3-polyprenylbenzoate decarboxylase [Desulfotomaculum arcticum]|uniref:4-hydroxy-3-polyprenylbenzoate decarboxylase n=1 Tax=Desulfotruncus arcticus DSM 17038 TaxID=1121424 RepID=A0A1I2YIF5_9FIRM|nr:UbiD family decarboxylase [Desulfotruncus arcticus]SFH25405.1 4-hydroxy-3-polyprenylbenzoate decarboxylase [Desulfotomaculum arcticum] [Desulfotruncus arcticus DSM 17038]
MLYKSMKECILDLEKHGHLVRVHEEVDPDLEMAEIHRRVHQVGGPAILYERVKGSPFPAVSNLYGTMDRARFIFRSTLKKVMQFMQIPADPMTVVKQPWEYTGLPITGLKALPKKVRNGPVLACETTISRLPGIKCWPDDGGPFILLPQVYSEDPEQLGIMRSNLGMYRVQMAGNQYIKDQEIGLHYQIQRDIGLHHAHALKKDEPLKVSIFVGGPPGHTLAAIMPLPEQLPEVAFAGMLAGHRFRYTYRNGYAISTDADFCVTGTVTPGKTKPEGPFGDHMGYYSLQHEFPYLNVEHVYHRKDAVWPFTVVGRPPQEDTIFGTLIHEITKPVVPTSIPGVEAIHAVDAAGVHPLLLAVGREQYVPYAPREPRQILTLANAILGFGQCSLAKYLFIAALEDRSDLDVNDVQAYFTHVLERVDWRRDLHFQTRTTIDTLDYSGTGFNQGSKLVVAAAGEPKRTLARALDHRLKLPDGFNRPALALPGVVVISAPACLDAETSEKDVLLLADYLGQAGYPDDIALVVITEDSEFATRHINNFLWVAFTRSNPSHDVYGVDSFIDHKHWGCRGPLIIDARLKPHHAPPLIESPEISRRVDRLGAKGGSLHGII